MEGSDGFNYDLNEARLHGNIFEKIFHNRRLQFWLSRIDYKNKKILDIGCNTGILLIPFAKRGADIYGIDISKSDVSKVKAELKKLKLSPEIVKVADVRKIPYPDNYFEIVILSDVLEHVSSPEMAVKEAVRVIKPKGKVYITVPNGWHPVVKYPWVRKLLTGRKDVYEHLDVPFNKQKLINLFPKNKVENLSFTGFFSEIFGVFTK